MKQQLTPRINRNEINAMIDGSMQIWPQGTSISITTGNNAYGSVLFRTYNGATGVTLTNSQQASVPSLGSLPFSNQISKTAAGSVAASTAVYTVYAVEGYDIERFITQSFSVIFWVKSTVASKRSVVIQNASASHSYVQQYQINAANTWEMKVLTFNALNTCPGTINRTNGVGMFVGFGVVAGSTFQTSTLNAWTSGGFVSGTGEDSTWVTGTTHDFSIAGTMVLPGDWTALTAAQYTFVRAGRSWQDEFAKTQRYFEKTYDDGVNPGTATFAGAVNAHPGSLGGTSTTGANWQFKVTKRASPTITIYGSFAGTTNDVSITANASPPETSDVAGTVYHTGTNGTSARPTAAVAIQSVSYQAIADSRF